MYTVYLVFLIGSLVLLFIGTKFYPGYSIKTHWISNLDKTTKASRPFFISALTLLLFCTPFVLIIGSKLLMGYLVVQIGFVGVLYLLAVSISGVLVCPSNLDIKRHLKWGGLLLSSLVLFHTLFLLIAVKQIFSNSILTVLSLALLVLCLLFVLSIVKLFKKYNLSLDNLQGISGTETSWLIKNHTLLEWSVLLVNYLWFAVLSFS